MKIERQRTLKVAPLLLLMFATLPAAGSWFKDPTLSHDVQSTGWRKLSCHVRSCDVARQQIAVADAQGREAYIPIDGRIQIFRHWRLVQLADLESGDHIILRRLEDE